MGGFIRATKIFTFDAAHCLPGHKGKCAQVHGHTYRLEVTVARPGGDLVADGSSAGMVVDFGDLSQIVKELIVDKVDHKMLNEVFEFRTTSENMAQYIFNVLSARLQVIDIEVERVALWESPNSCAEVLSCRT